MQIPEDRRLLICSDWYYPAVKAGGPVRSVCNLAALLAGSLSIRVLTSDRDLGDSAPFNSVRSGSWQELTSGVGVFYGRGIQRGLEFVRSLRGWRPAVVYLNSMFSFWGTIWPLLWLRFCRRECRVVLAPRGMLKSSAMAFRRTKKSAFILLARMCGLFRGVEFHATSAEEAAEIRKEIGDVRIHLVANVPQTPLRSLEDREFTGRLRLVAVGRVHPIKNTHLIFEMLSHAGVACDLFIVGPEEDAVYSEVCRQAARAVQGLVSTVFCGTLSGGELEQMVGGADLMISPTSGENFGHAIFEALASGTPVLISDRTIWRDLAASNAGWEFATDRIQDFAGAIRSLSEMGPSARQTLRQGALNFANSYVAKAGYVEAYGELFGKS